MSDATLISPILATIFNIVYFAIILITIFIVIMDNRNPVKTMAWILVLFFLPIIGLIFYFFFGRSTRREQLISKKGYARLNKRPMEEYLSQESLEFSKENNRLADFFNNVNKALPFGGNEISIHTDGKSMLSDLLREISQARHHIHLQFYIFENDAAGRLLRDALIDKSREGVKVRLLYDDVGCWKVDNMFYDQMLCEGIEVLSFLKVRFPRFTSKVNYRNHRKIVIIDGRVGFIGYGLQTSFLTDWYAIDRTLITGSEYFPIIKDKGNVTAQIVTSDPVGQWRDIMQGIMMAICTSRKYIYIQTPYFLPTEEVMTALQTAALAGIDVRIMIPKRADARLIHIGTLSYLDELMEAGIKVFFYEKGFLHSKMLVSDDELSTIGSTNIDFRSFEHNFEANAFFYDRKTSLDLKEIFLNDLKSCTQLSLKTWRQRPWKNRIIESVVRLLAPLL